MGNVYCTADWHGCLEPANEVFKFLKPDDKIYFLGDVIDRGKDGVKLFTRLANDNRFIMLKGNHEELMEDAVPYLLEGKYNAAGHWLQNGGDKTWNTLDCLSETSIQWYLNKIKKMPTEVVYKSSKGHKVILEHAGYSPFALQHRSHNPLWDREHFYDNWFEGIGAQETARDTFLVHGHTPVQYLKYMYGYKGQPSKTKEDMIGKRQFVEEKFIEGEPIIKPEVIRYCDGHKFDVDMCTIVSNRIALLNLDTFEVHYFDANEEKKNA